MKKVEAWVGMGLDLNIIWWAGTLHVSQARQFNPSGSLECSSVACGNQNFDRLESQSSTDRKKLDFSNKVPNQRYLVLFAIEVKCGKLRQIPKTVGKHGKLWYTLYMVKEHES